MNSTDCINLFNLSPLFMDSKFGCFKGGEEINVEDDTGNILIADQPFFQNSLQWNQAVSGRSELKKDKVSQAGPGNFINGGYHSFEDIVSKILDEDPPQLKVDHSEKVGKTNYDKIPNEYTNHGMFSPINNGLLNSNGCFIGNNTGQSVFSPNIINQVNDYKNVSNPIKPHFTNQVENGLVDHQQSFNNSNVNYIENYFLSLQNAFLSNPDLFKSTMNPSLQNHPNTPQFNVLENLINANAMKQSVNLSDLNQLGRQIPNNQMHFQNQKNIFFSNNQPYRLNIPIYKPTSTFRHISSQFQMDTMPDFQCNYNANQHNHQVNNNSMLFKNQMDLKASNNLPNSSVVLYVDLCVEQLNQLSKEELKMFSQHEGNSSCNDLKNHNSPSSFHVSTNVHIKLNNVITECFRLHYKLNLLLKEACKLCTGQQVERGVQVVLEGWLGVVIGLQGKYKEELICNINRSGAFSYNDGLSACLGAYVEELHLHLRRVRTALWSVQQSSLKHDRSTMPQAYSAHFNYAIK